MPQSVLSRSATIRRAPKRRCARLEWPSGIGLSGIRLACQLGSGHLRGGFQGGGTGMLNSDILHAYVDAFNAADDEVYANAFPNAQAQDFLSRTVPLFECPDKELELTYYFRWWTYRKHIKQTPDGWVITEFLPPVPWAGKHNTIDMAAGLHMAEGRWLADPQYLDDYATFWFRRGGDPYRYTTWLAHAIWERAAVTGDARLPVALLDDLVAYYRTWEQGKASEGMGGRPNGLFYITDGQDGGEVSIGGHGFRPLLNSAMFGEAAAIAAIARTGGRRELADEFAAKAASTQQRVQDRLWDPEREFFMILKEDDATRTTTRELYGFAPWCFNLPAPGYEAGWRHLLDPQGFGAPFGPTFTEQREPGFALAYSGHECQWNGPSWPLATAVVLTGLANLLNGYDQTVIGRRAFFDALLTYARSHRLVHPDGRIVPWIDENLNPYTGDWISRTLLLQRKQAPAERGKDYNHSTFCDLVIGGLVGIRPQHDDSVVINPLLPDGTWDWFCLDRVRYHGHDLTVAWDRDGSRYGRGKGLHVLIDGQPAAHADTLTRLNVALRP